MREIVVSMTREEWRKAIEESEPCPKCGCRLLELDEELGALCARCGKPYPFAEDAGGSE